MAIDPALYVGDFDVTLPAADDKRNEGDDNFRQVKTAVNNSFPSVTGPITLTHTQINQACIKNEANTVSGAWDFSATGNVIELTGGSAQTIRKQGSGDLILDTGGATQDVDLRVNGVSLLRCEAGQIVCSQELNLPDGVASSPSVKNQTGNSGLYFSGQSVRLVESGTWALETDAPGDIRVNNDLNVDNDLDVSGAIIKPIYACTVTFDGNRDGTISNASPGASGWTVSDGATPGIQNRINHSLNTTNYVVICSSGSTATQILGVTNKNSTRFDIVAGSQSPANHTVEVLVLAYP